jgi:hypothetical protein
LQTVTLFFVADFFSQLFFERHQQIEGDVCRLKVLSVGLRDVVDERAQRCFARYGRGACTLRGGCGVEPGEQAGGDRFGVALDAGNLSGEVDAGVVAQGALM